MTGGSRGIGAAICRELARGGAQVAVNYRSSREEAEAIAGEIGGLAVEGDVSDPGQARELVERTESELGDVDILVNNAGVTRDTLIARMSDEDWDVVLATNLSCAFYTSRAVARKMLRRRAGSIVNMSSFVGLHGNPGQANYAASKAGPDRLHEGTRQGARHARGPRERGRARLHRRPSITSGLSDEVREFLLGETALGRLGTPEDVAARGTVPVLGRGELRHRRSSPRRRRLGDVMAR